MLQSNFDLWNLPPNVNTDLDILRPLDAIRTIGCGIGYTATDGLIQLGREGTELLQRTGDYIAEQSTRLGDYVGSSPTLDRYLTSVENGTQQAMNTIHESVQDAGTYIGDYVGSSPNLDNALTSVENGIQDASNFVSDTASTAADYASEGGSYILDTARTGMEAGNSAVNAIGNGLQDSWNYLGSWFE